MKPLLNLIGRIEANGNYNAVFGNANSTRDLSQFSVRDIQRMQYLHGRRTGSSAFGKYQFIRKTLRNLLDDLDIPDSAKFTPELQDELALELLERRGLSKWEAGKISTEKFLDNLSKEWASLPYHTGRSYYAGDGLNKSLVSRAEVRKALLSSTPENFTQPETSFCASKTLRIDARGPCVTKIQSLINLAFPNNNLKTDGVFGPVTLQEVKRFQYYKQLLSDGIVGPKTWAALEQYA
jgi:muramidase (phage lysozyme)